MHSKYLHKTTGEYKQNINKYQNTFLLDPSSSKTHGKILTNEIGKILI